MSAPPPPGDAAGAAYLDDVRAVIAAGHRLEAALQADPPVRRAAERRLETALLQQERGSDPLGSLMFAAGSGASATPAPEPALEDGLATVLLEVQVANLSLTAGGALGEAGPPQDAGTYDQALRDLRASAAELDATMAANQGLVPSGELGFRAHRGQDEARVASASVDAARSTLSTSVDRTLGAIVDDSRDVALAVWAEASRLPGARVLEDLIRRARDPDVPESGLGRMIAFGLRKLAAAIAALRRLFGLGDVEDVGPHLAPVWSTLEAQDPLRRALVELYGGPATIAARDHAVAANLPIERLDEASQAVDRLASRFGDIMRLARKLLRALVVASGVVAALVAFVPAVGINHVALTAAGYLLLMAGVVLSGIDHMDSGTALGRVDGVRCLLASLAP
jgi:hypothetical protein